MLPSSARLVASSTRASRFASKRPTASGSRAVAVWSFTCRPFHQRRHSSSKPPSTDGDAKDSPARQSVHPSPSSRSDDTKSSNEKRRRKSKGLGETDSGFEGLPSVPSTKHVSQEALGLSNFFSLHRPISVTHSLPKTVTAEEFATIFTHKSRANKVTEVMSSLSRTVDELEGPMAKMTIASDAESDVTGESVHKIDFKHPDGRESSVYVQLNAMSGQFLPFQPPPLPELQDAEAMVESLSSSAEHVPEEETPQHRVYQAMFNIEETTDADGQVRILAHSPKIMQDETQQRPFAERVRRFRYEDATKRRGTLELISVKRQRKLKMKKKKYKKLMKRTRNLRRKLDRL